jgi:hypothetical protein
MNIGGSNLWIKGTPFPKMDAPLDTKRCHVWLSDRQIAHLMSAEKYSSLFLSNRYKVCL